jgi:hypothetical protein
MMRRDGRTKRRAQIDLQSELLSFAAGANRTLPLCNWTGGGAAWGWTADSGLSWLAPDDIAAVQNQKGHIASFWGFSKRGFFRSDNCRIVFERHLSLYHLWLRR